MRDYEVSLERLGIPLIGTPDTPQEILYSSLTDITGESLPATFASAPAVNLTGVNGDFGVYYPVDPDTTKFTVSRGRRFIPGVPLIRYANFRIVGISASVTGGIVAERMADLLAMYLGDLKEGMKHNMKAMLLNIGQWRLMDRLERHTLSELDEVLSAEVVDANNVIDMGGFATAVFENERGIDGIRLTDGKFCDKLSFYEFRKYENIDKVFNVDNPIYYVRDNKIYPKPATASTTECDIYYMKRPQTIVLANNPVNNVDCELSPKKQIAVIGMACQKFVDRTKEAAYAYEEALEIIAELNSSSAPTDSNINQIDRFKGTEEYTGYGEEEAGYTINVQRYELP